MTKRRRGPWRIAVHEAGHVVIAYLRQRAFKFVTIEPDEDSAGSVHHTRLNPYREFETEAGLNRRIRTEIMLALGGVEAEAVVFGRRSWATSVGDRINADNAADCLSATDEEAAALLKWLQLRTHALLKRPIHKEAVLTLAEKLLELRRIKATMARKIVRQAIIDAANRERPLPKFVKGADGTIRVVKKGSDDDNE